MDFQEKRAKKKKNHLTIYIIETQKERKERGVAYEMLEINV